MKSRDIAHEFANVSTKSHPLHDRYARGKEYVRDNKVKRTFTGGNMFFGVVESDYTKHPEPYWVRIDLTKELFENCICTCPDFKYRNANPCKHIFAVLIIYMNTPKPASKPGLSELEAQIEEQIRLSTENSQDYVTEFAGSQALFVAKYVPLKYIESYLTKGFYISTSPGFTWGDGVYVTLPKFHDTAQIYGRAIVMGRLSVDDSFRAYDATNGSIGLDLYQQWITFFSGLYRLLTTTAHSNFANRQLRNKFRGRFGLDAVTFTPDEFESTNISKSLQSRWFCLTDKDYFLGMSKPEFSRRIKDCDLVAIGVDEFQRDKSGMIYQSVLKQTFKSTRYFAGNLSGGPIYGSDLISTYVKNHGRSLKELIAIYE